jgi:lipopolysaccharide biosynthesis protein
MANHTGSEGTVKVGANAVAEIRSFSIDETGDTIEDTALGDSFRSFKAGMRQWSGTIDTWWDETDTNGQGVLDVGSSVTLNFQPEGSDSGDTQIQGTALITGKTINSSFDGMVEASYSVQGSGGLTESTA